jgi:hypothetical protein
LIVTEWFESQESGMLESCPIGHASKLPGFPASKPIGIITKYKKIIQ